MQYNDANAGRTNFHEELKKIGKVNPGVESTLGQFTEFIEININGDQEQSNWKAEISGHEKIEDETVKMQVLNAFHKCFPGQE